MSERKKLFNFFKNARLLKSSTYGAMGHLLIPESTIKELKEHCPGCGKPLYRRNPQVWFGDTFCGPCVERYKKGESSS